MWLSSKFDTRRKRFKGCMRNLVSKEQGFMQVDFVQKAERGNIEDMSAKGHNRLARLRFPNVLKNRHKDFS